MERLSGLERAVLLAIAEQVPEHAASLRAQISSALVIERQNTGVGFYAKLVVSRGSALDGVASPVGDVGAIIESLEGGMGFLLWLQDGLIETLEGYTYGDDGTEDLNLVDLRYSDVRPRTP